jgi:cytochrome c oxidase assembly protein subunit 15
MSSPSQHTLYYQPSLELFCRAALVVAGFVLLAGGETTSNQAGMAFQTWPLSNGSLNPTGWLTNLNMFLEHSHRLLAGTTTILTVIAAIWVQRTETRAWVKRIAWILVGTIFVQAILGGLRVLFDNTNTGAANDNLAHIFAVCHAVVAQATVCLWVTLTVAVSRGWMVREAGARLVAPQVRKWGHIACAMLFLQIIAGAIMRQFGYSFAIPVFPWSSYDHSLLPPAWSWPVIVNFAHRTGAICVTFALAGLAASVFTHAGARRQLGSWMALVLCALVLQICLGAEIIWTNKNPNVATFHLLSGAFLLASTWLVTFLSYRSKWWPPSPAD